MEKRTSVDWSKHEHKVEIFTCGEKEIRVDHFQVGDSKVKYIKFINTDETLTITGDYGNWVFCRPFVPSKDGYVSDGYWLEKLRISSEQKLSDLDFESISKEIEELINSGLEEYGYENEKLNQAKEWFKELLEETDDEISYYAKAFRDYSKPNFIDYEMIPTTKKMPSWLNVIFDAFDEMCRRLKEDNNESS
jgi:hypothetical protein